ncbi:MAG: hypothetical protein FRX49_13351, partial [Trebouxia sp. A1-2]
KCRSGSRQLKSGKRTGARSVTSQHQRDSEGLPRVFCATLPLAVQAARSFNATFPCDLRLFTNDCWTHSEALARHLVGDHIEIKSQK